ncbi:hypothetical protein KVQ82_23260 [Pseudomonas sp. AO-1]|uniref:hypothetical protein n=1 Tax=Pseudomonas TaxID=286 RepID=UPI00115BA705|nr:MULTISPECIES: hypothetical protein [Pseudomonas]MBI6949018.1 hypothetical protein [Pseudomonas koreensis]QXZ12969.1 hypothetical protein KVQ82_23260 [Pseudomonas sp. AO-1]
MIVHFLSFFAARINGYTSGSPANAQGPGRQDWAIIEPSTDYRNPRHRLFMVCLIDHGAG